MSIRFDLILRATNDLHLNTEQHMLEAQLRSYYLCSHIIKKTLQEVLLKQQENSPN